MGASVLHEDAIYPARTADIPINIRNTNRPQDPGTMISSEMADHAMTLCPDKHNIFAKAIPHVPVPMIDTFFINLNIFI